MLAGFKASKDLEEGAMLPSQSRGTCADMSINLCQRWNAQSFP